MCKLIFRQVKTFLSGSFLASEHPSFAKEFMPYLIILRYFGGMKRGINYKLKLAASSLAASAAGTPTQVVLEEWPLEKVKSKVPQQWQGHCGYRSQGSAWAVGRPECP
jgi:hypothetical protein